MANTKTHGLYSLVGDDDSETIVAGSVDSFEKTLGQDHHRASAAHASRTADRRRTECIAWLRWTFIVALQTVIIALLAIRSTAPVATTEVETGGDVNGLYPTVNHDYRRLKFEDDFYMPNMTSNADRLEVRQRWDKLMPLGSGSVSVPDWRSHPSLGPPISDDPSRSGPLYEASWTHALHCLYYSVDSYHQLVVDGRTGKENPHHASHCFEYLRTSILCNLDMTLEGSYSANRESGGQAHVCRNREQAVQWIEDRRVDDMQDIVGP